MAMIDFTIAKFAEMPSKGIHRYIKCTSGSKCYVLKGLKPEYASKRQYQLLLKREFEAVKRLNSAYLPTYYELLEDSQYGRCIVEEFIEGRSLAAYIAEGHTPTELDTVVRGIATALQSIHSHYTAHRNVTPTNIIVTKRADQVRLIDLRPAYADEIQVPYTSNRYLAPEQKDETVAIDGRADVYALGIIMREMDLPARYTAVIARCCCLGRSDRFADTAEMVAALDGKQGPNNTLKYALLALVAAIVVTVVVAVCFMGGKTTSSGEQPAAIVDTLQTEEPQPDTLKTASTLPIDGIQQQIVSSIDQIYQPYLAADTIGAAERRAARKQVKRYYHELMKTVGTVNDADRARIDQIFGDYAKQKQQELVNKQPQR